VLAGGGGRNQGRDDEYQIPEGQTLR